MFYMDFRWWELNDHYYNMIFGEKLISVEYFCRENDKERKLKLSKELD